MSDDETVDHEVDVYLSKALVENLFLFQYPVRPSTMTYDNDNHLKARIKPKQQKVELELAIDTHSPNYDKHKGEQIAFNTDGRTSSDTYFQSHLMDKQILTSTKAVPNTVHYSVGLLKQGELHITPLHSIIQLRPCFTYMDKSDALAKLENSGGVADENMQEEEEEAKAVTVRFASSDAEKAKLVRERSYSYLQQKIASEPWIEVNYHPYGSKRSELENEMLICSQMDRDASNLPVTPKEYLKLLVPDALLFPAVSEQESSRSVKSITSIRSLPIQDQIKFLMINAKVLRFRQLVELLPSGIDNESMLRYLQQVAMMIQGCWVVKSEQLYPKDSVSPTTGINTEVLIRARDYIMWCYTKKTCITRKEVLSVIKLPDEDAKEIISQMGKQVYKKGWEFIYPFDQDFVDSYPAVAQRQQMLWEAHYQHLARALRLGQKEARVPLDQKMHSLPKQRQRRRAKSQRESFSDDTEESGTEGFSIEKMDIDPVRMKKEPRSHKLLSGPGESMDIGSASGIRNGPKSRMNSHIATFEVSPTLLDINPSPELKAELLNFAREKLRSRFCLTLNELKKLLWLKLSESPPGHILSKGVSDKLLEETIVEAGAQRLNNKWPQNTAPEPLYAFAKFGDNLDRYREALLDLFTRTARTRIGFFQKKVEDELSEIASEADCKQLFEEYCIYKSGFYYLKGTISPDS